jgi:hyperosmotically inducible protein
MKLLAAVVLFCGFAFSQSQSGTNSHLAIRPGPQDANEQHIAKEVRHELLMLPYYSIFDDLEFSVNGDTVTLMGAVVNPTLKKDAENAVKHIEGVRQVENQIKVLPPSPEDDRIRVQVARAIYNQDGLYRYFQGAVGSIHIIVENGHVTLKGVVDNQSDDTMAKMAANQVPGVFSVKDELQIGGQSNQGR